MGNLKILCPEELISSLISEQRGHPVHQPAQAIEMFLETYEAVHKDKLGPSGLPVFCRKVSSHSGHLYGAHPPEVCGDGAEPRNLEGLGPAGPPYSSSGPP